MINVNNVPAAGLVDVYGTRVTFPGDRSAANIAEGINNLVAKVVSETRDLAVEVARPNDNLAAAYSLPGLVRGLKIAALAAAWYSAFL